MSGGSDPVDVSTHLGRIAAVGYTVLEDVIDGNAKLKVTDAFTEEDGGVELFTRSKAFDERILDTWEAARRGRRG